MKKVKQKMSFTKKGWITIMIMVTIIVAIGLVQAWVTGDSTVYMYLIPAVFAELGVYTHGMIRKSEKENTKGGIVYETAMADGLESRRSSEEYPVDDPA